jgi:predicted RNA-binding Zn-ribbon protein involved in translation (DUF1610 family)
MSFSNKQCPDCGKVINRASMAQSPDDAKWYQLTSIKLSCPYCGIKLKRDNKSQIIAFIVFIGSITIGYISSVISSEDLKYILMVFSTCMFWGSFLLFSYLFRYVKQ